LAVTELALSEVHGSPLSVWSVKQISTDNYDRYIVISYSNATLVLAVGDAVEEVSNTGIDTGIMTLLVGRVGMDTLVQVHSNGVKFINSKGQVNDWKSGKKSVLKATLNEKQIILALSGGELVYLEHESGVSFNEIARKEIQSEVSSLAISPVTFGEQRGHFLAVGTIDNRVRLYRVSDRANTFNQISVQDIGELPESLLITALTVKSSQSSRSDLADAGNESNTFLYIGLQNGVLIRSKLDDVTGTISDARKSFLGTRPVKVFSVTVHGRSAVLAISSRTWLSYYYQQQLRLAPLSYDALDYASNFTSDQCPEGIVGISGTSLRIFSIEKLGDVFNQTVIPARYTPRKFVLHPATNNLIVAESDNRTYSESMKALMQDYMQVDSSQERADDQDEKEIVSYVYPNKAQDGHWASCIRILDPVQGETLSILELPSNQSAVSLAIVEFLERGSEIFLAVGVVKDMVLQPRSITSASIHIYRFVSDFKVLELLHETPVDAIPLALAPFQGRLLAGVGSALRVYDIGKKKLLRKAENRNIPNTIRWIESRGDRIYIGDVVDGFHMLTYRKAEKQLVLFADCTIPRFLTASALLDYNTIAGADKFGSVFVYRLPEEISEESDSNTGAYVEGESWLHGAPNKLKDIINFYVGDTVTSLQKTSMIPGDPGVLLYSTLGGSVGVFIPFTSREDIDFFSVLEMNLRQVNAPLSSRDHLAYRSYYCPVKDTVDGDLCEQFNSLSHSKQTEICVHLECEVSDVVRKLEEIRSRFL
jgi:splicing factor 3B subunit 3